MANSDFIVKNGLSVNSVFTANGTNLLANGLSVNSTFTVANGTLKAATNVFTVNTTVLMANGMTVNSTHASFSANISGTINTVSQPYITANNSTNLNGQPASFYVNATNITTGTLATARLPATANVSTAINVGANVNLTTSGISIGNSTVNATINSTSFSGTANAATYLVGSAGIGSDLLSIPRNIDLGSAAFADIDAIQSFKATGTSTIRNIADRAADVINVKDHGAVDDAQMAFDIITIPNGSANVAFASDLFTANDVGKIIGISRVSNRKLVSFDAATDVSEANSAIAVSTQLFTTGASAFYEVSAGNTAIGGLVANTMYYVQFANSTHVKLSKTTDGPAIQLSAGTGTGHNLAIYRLNISFNAQTNINASTDAIELGVANQYFTDGDSIYYNVETGNTVISGLADNGYYYVVQSNSTHIKLSETVGGSPIGLTPGLSETGHTIRRPQTPFINYVTITAVNDANNITVSSVVSASQEGTVGGILASNCGIVWGTDSYAGLANAVSASIAANGGAIYVPAGNFVYGNPLHIGSNTTVFGDGPSSLLISAGHVGSQSPTGTGAMITNINGYYANGVMKKGFTDFTPTDSNAYVDENIVIRDLGFNQIGGTPGGSGKTLFFVLAKNIKIENCYFEAPTTTKDFISMIGCDNVDEIGNIGKGVQIMHDHWGGCSRMRVIGNVMETKIGNGLQAINFNAQGTAATDYNKSYNIICRDNIIIMNGGDQYGGGHTAIFLDGLQIGSPSENYIIENNTIIGRSGYKNLGIIGRGVGGKFKISGNRLYNIGSTSSPDIPILIGGRANNTLFTIASNKIETTSGSDLVKITTGTHNLTNNAISEGLWLRVPAVGTVGGIEFTGISPDTFLRAAYTANSTAVFFYAPSAATSTATGGSSSSSYYWWYGTPYSNHIIDNVIVNTPTEDCAIYSDAKNTIIEGNIIEFEYGHSPAYEAAIKLSSIEKEVSEQIVTNNRLVSGSNTFVSGSWQGDGRIAWVTGSKAPQIIDYDQEADRIAISSSNGSAVKIVNTTFYANGDIFIGGNSTVNAAINSTSFFIRNTNDFITLGAGTIYLLSSTGNEIQMTASAIDMAGSGGGLISLVADSTSSFDNKIQTPQIDFTGGGSVNTTIYTGTALTANHASFLGNSSGTIANVSSWITSNAAAAYSNAVANSANATNITSGTLATARLPATANISTAINVGANVNISTSEIRIGNSTVNSVVNSTSFSGTANHAITATSLTGSDGVGIDSPLSIPRNMDLGSAAYIDVDAITENIISENMLFEISPTANPTIPGTINDTYSGIKVQGTTRPDSNNRHWLAVFGMTSSSGNNSSGNNKDNVTLYAGLDMEANSGDGWAFNTVTTIRADVDPERIAYGYELDVNNLNSHRDTFDYPIYGLGVTGASTYRSTAALLVAGPNDRAIWSRGIAFVTNSVYHTTFEDQTNSNTSILINGSHLYGVDLGTGSFTNAAIRVAVGGGIKLKTSGDDSNIFYADSANSVVIGAYGSLKVYGYDVGGGSGSVLLNQTTAGGWSGLSAFESKTGSSYGYAGSFYHDNTSTAGAAIIARVDEQTGPAWANLIRFYNGSTAIGSISVATASSVAYNTTSDYRLKVDLKPIIYAADTIDKIKVYDHGWSTHDQRSFGVLAHELAEIIPGAVSGVKDAVDEKGFIIPQQVDYSKLIPHLIASIQELNSRVKSLEQDIIDLKGVE